MKHALIVLFVFISSTLFAQHPKEDSTLFFDNALLNNVPVSNYLNGWYITQGESFVDSTTTYNGHKSLCLLSSTPSSSQLFAGYYIRLDDIEADSVSFSCKYKIAPENKTRLYIDVQQLYNNPTNFKHDAPLPQMVNEGSTNVQEWQEFSIKEVIKPNVNAIFLSVLTSGGDSKIWLNDCKVYFNNKPLGDFVNVKYKANADREFDKASGISLPSLTPIMIDNLEILGKVWGFLKYYHPKVAKGNYNWDYELFRTLPSIANAKDKKERNRLLNQWIDRYGPINETKDYSITDPSMYSHLINLDWLNDRGVFDDKLVAKFKRIRSAKRGNTHYYIQGYISRTDSTKCREPQYLDISWEDQGFRLLTLFKFWNEMEYNFPFVDITD